MQPEELFDWREKTPRGTNVWTEETDTGCRSLLLLKVQLTHIRQLQCPQLVSHWRLLQSWHSKSISSLLLSVEGLNSTSAHQQLLFWSHFTHFLVFIISRSGQNRLQISGGVRECWHVSKTSDMTAQKSTTWRKNWTAFVHFFVLLVLLLVDFVFPCNCGPAVTPWGCRVKQTPQEPSSAWNEDKESLMCPRKDLDSDWTLDSALQSLLSMESCLLGYENAQWMTVTVSDLWPPHFAWGVGTKSSQSELYLTLSESVLAEVLLSRFSVFDCFQAPTAWFQMKIHS